MELAAYTHNTHTRNGVLNHLKVCAHSPADVVPVQPPTKESLWLAAISIASLVNPSKQAGIGPTHAFCSGLCIGLLASELH